MDTTAPGTAIILDQAGAACYTNPLEVVTAETLADVRPALERVEQHVAQGRTAIGFVSYEAAPAFDTALQTHPPANLPLLWFGIYNQSVPSQSGDAVPWGHETAPAQPSIRRDPILLGPPLKGVPGPSIGGQASRVGDVPLPASACAWASVVKPAEYHAALQRIRDYIAAGDTYQVNYTFPLATSFNGAGLSWFLQLCWAQRPGLHGDQRIYIDTGRFQILSISPELFFTLDGNHLTTRPMKGTRRRGRWTEEDLQRARELAQSPKDQAENVMIVDMIRNDLGRICETGSVRVDELFAVERYDTVWQMTSTISGECRAGMPEIFAALFPSASVTGAPKVRTMQIIHELEAQPRGVYCGGIGWWRPNRQAKFSVAIRTATIDSHSGRVMYPVGSGVTWDSSPSGEYQECLDKAAILTQTRPDFDLLETMLWDGQEIFLRDRHIDRLEASSGYFGRHFERAQVVEYLADSAAGLGPAPQRIRLTVDATGAPSASASPLPPTLPMNAALALAPIDPDDVFLYHKTTHRRAYEQARAARPGVDEVILWNPDGFVTECTIGNLVLEVDGRRVTPPIACGLLPGTFRAELLATGEIEEEALKLQDLQGSTRIWLINSVRKWVELTVEQ